MQNGLDPRGCYFAINPHFHSIVMTKNNLKIKN